MRLKEIRLARGLSQKKVALDLNLSPVVYGRYENGTRQPPHAILLMLAEYFGVSTDYLLGRGKGSQSPPAPTKEGVRIPVVGRVPAGVPFTAIEEVLDWEEIAPEQAKKGEYFALKVKGDSMEPRICDGDVLIIRKQSTAETGDIVIALIDGEDATVKKLKLLDEGMALIPTNPAYDPLIFTKRDIETLPVEIIGVVVENRQKYK